jgi:hypothetical protein
VTRFVDGPASGTVLQLRRAPVLLRVVRGHAGEWDALDQLEDVPRADETLVVYRRVGRPSRCHINAGRGRSGWYAIAEYRVVADQPTEDVVRDTRRWRAWALAYVASAVA